MSRWFQKKEEELPEKLRGKTEEDLVKAMEEAEALRASAAEKDAEVARLRESQTSQQTEFEAVKAKLAELEANAAPTWNEEPKGPASVFVNEEQAFIDRTSGLRQQIAQSGALTARLTAREAVQNSTTGRTDMRIWDKYANEINTLMSREAPDRQIDPRSWANAFIYVKGLHFSDLLDAQANKKDIFAEPATSSGTVPETEKQEDKLTDQELEIAKKFKMTPEKYLERKKAMRFVNV